MLTLEDRILRLELLTGIVNTVSTEIVPIERMRELRNHGHSMDTAKRKCIEEYFDRKEQENAELRKVVDEALKRSFKDMLSRAGLILEGLKND